MITIHTDWENAVADMSVALNESGWKGKLEITVRPAPKNRSLTQLNYYWNTIVPQCRSGFQGIGNDYDLKETHRQLAGRFLYAEYEKDGDIEHLPLSLKTDAVPRVTPEIMASFIDRCKQFAAEDLNTFIP